MVKSDPQSGVIRVRPDGSPVDIDDNALAILRMTREQFMAAPPGALSARPLPEEERQALRDEWERSGRPEMVGASTIRRGDGTEARVSFLVEAQPDGTLIAIITPLDEPVAQPTRFYTAADVLRQWRSAEREMADVPRGTAEWNELSSRVAELRATYHELVDTQHRDGAGGC